MSEQDQDIETVTHCDDCPLWNDDRMYCQHPESENFEKYEHSYDMYFPACPLRKKPLTIKLSI